MAWRPTQHLIDGELDNTFPGRVIGWMRFAGRKQKVAIELNGNFHRDIRGAKICLRGPGDDTDPDAVNYMESFATRQTGKVGDITAGRAPSDYVRYPYIEWFSEQNGRVVIELEREQVTVIGMPIPFIESDPISRDEQRQNMTEFLSGLLREIRQSEGDSGEKPAATSDPQFSHWVLRTGEIIGEARDVKTSTDGMRFAFVRLFETPEFAEFGYIPARLLREKSGQAHV